MWQKSGRDLPPVESYDIQTGSSSEEEGKARRGEDKRRSSVKEFVSVYSIVMTIWLASGEAGDPIVINLVWLL